MRGERTQEAEGIFSCLDCFPRFLHYSHHYGSETDPIAKYKASFYALRTSLAIHPTRLFFNRSGLRPERLKKGEVASTLERVKFSYWPLMIMRERGGQASLIKKLFPFFSDTLMHVLHVYP